MSLLVSCSLQFCFLHGHDPVCNIPSSTVYDSDSEPGLICVWGDCLQYTHLVGWILQRITHLGQAATDGTSAIQVNTKSSLSREVYEKGEWSS